MPQDSNTATDDVPHDRNTGHRRGRSASQPVTPVHNAPMSSPSTRAVDPLDFSFLNQYNAGPSSAPSYPQPVYSDDAFARAVRSLQESPSVVPQVPPIPPPSLNPALNPALNPMSSQPMPNPTEAFLAAIPWLQYLQIQSIYGQQQQHQPQHHQLQQQQQLQYMPPPPMPQVPFGFDSGQLGSFVSNDAGPSEPPQLPPPQPVSNPPSPEAAEPQEGDQIGSSDDKRRRNTAASARFRIKKKQWTLNLERGISDLSGRVEELEREAGELRRENGWLKEIVMLKSKRLAGVVPDLEQGTSSSTPGNTSSPGGEPSSSRDGSSERPGEKGKGRQVG